MNSPWEREIDTYTYTHTQTKTIIILQKKILHKKKYIF